MPRAGRDPIVHGVWEGTSADMRLCGTQGDDEVSEPGWEESQRAGEEEGGGSVQVRGLARMQVQSMQQDAAAGQLKGPAAGGQNCEDMQSRVGLEDGRDMGGSQATKVNGQRLVAPGDIQRGTRGDTAADRHEGGNGCGQVALLRIGRGKAGGKVAKRVAKHLFPHMGRSKQGQVGP